MTKLLILVELLSLTLGIQGCCPQYGAWSEWVADYSQCYDYCGSNGIITYNRNCSSAPACPCTGPTSYIATCNPGPCMYPRLKACYTGKTVQVINGKYSCAPLNNDTVLNENPYINTCNVSCCPSAGIWSTWTATSACSATCGACGVVPRTRRCLSAQYGCPCIGEANVTSVCARTPCSNGTACCTGFSSVYNVVTGSYECVNSTTGPDPEIVYNITTCCDPEGQGLWNDWASWSTCSATCGLCGLQTRGRTCASQKYGCPCNNLALQARPCANTPCNNTMCCANYTLTTSWDGYPICLVGNPTVGTWSDWTPVEGATCNDTCGACGAVQSTRTCLPAGATCVGASSGLAPCAYNACPFPRPSCCSPYMRITYNNATYATFMCVLNTTATQT